MALPDGYRLAGVADYRSSRTSFVLGAIDGNPINVTPEEYARLSKLGDPLDVWLREHRVEVDPAEWRG